MKLNLSLAVLMACLITSSVQADDEELFQDGDLVVFLGGTLVERAQEYGYWEAALQLSHPDKTLHIRNFGWSGDTVWAESRGQFDPAAKGYERMVEQVTAVKPDVIVFGYGNAEAFNGPDGVDEFIAQYKKLISDLPDTRRAFLPPVVPAFAPNESYKNAAVLYRQHVAQLAEVLDAPLVRLEVLDACRPEQNFYDKNRLHLTAEGNAAVATGFLAFSGVPQTSDARTPDQLTTPRLLNAIVAKNRLVFYRWRPQNITYLTLFRKHEQGNNYADIPKFDPLIDKADAEIDRIKREIAMKR